MELTLQDIERIFIEQFQCKPQIYFAPGRINLLGEHIDYNAGFVMPAAIEQGCWFAISATGTADTFHIYSATLKESIQGNFSQLKKMDGWKNYMLGVIDQFVQRGYPIKGFQVVFGGDLPVGAGLSSSAAVECGLAVALNGLFQLGINNLDIALMCQQAEHTYPGMKCGLMDQYASMLGSQNKILFMDCISNESELIHFPAEKYSIILFNTNVKHELVGGDYNLRRHQSSEGLKILQNTFPFIHQYRDARKNHLDAVKPAMTPDIYKRCLFVIEEIDRTIKGAALLQQNAITDFGKCMNASHEGLRDLYEVSCPESDFLVEMAITFTAVAGARQMGGGFGGCTINVIEKNETDKVIDFIRPRYYEKFKKETTVYSVTPGQGARKII